MARHVWFGRRVGFAALAAVSLFLAATPMDAQTPAAAPAAQPADGTPLVRRGWDVARLLGGGATDSTDYAALFAPTFLAQVPPARVAALFRQLAPLGTVERVEVVQQTSPAQGRLRLVTTGGFGVPVQLTVAPAAPHLVTGLFIEPPTKLAGTLDEITAELRTLPGAVSFLVARVEGDSLRPLAAIEPERRLAIGSAFKLYILAELVRQVEAGERRWSDVVRLDSAAASLPSGILHTWPHDAPLTVQTLATLMISQSDNTATDALLRLAGRERVEAVQAAAGHAAPALNVPFLGTRELFTLKGAADSTLAARYAAADAAGRRALLAGEVARTPRGGLAPFADGQPSSIDTIEWFASAGDLARAMRWLRDHTAAPATAPARQLLAVNPGVAFGDDWRYVGFKGGSEPGVLNMTWLLQADDGRWFVLSVGWNDPANPVEAARLVALVPRAAELARAIR